MLVECHFHSLSKSGRSSTSIPNQRNTGSGLQSSHAMTRRWSQRQASSVSIPIGGREWDQWLREKKLTIADVKPTHVGLVLFNRDVITKGVKEWRTEVL